MTALQAHIQGFQQICNWLLQVLLLRLLRVAGKVQPIGLQAHNLAAFPGQVGTCSLTYTCNTQSEAWTEKPLREVYCWLPCRQQLDALCWMSPEHTQQG